MLRTVSTADRVCLYHKWTAHMMTLQLPVIFCVCYVGYQDCGWEAGAGHWRRIAHHLHLLLPYGLQCEYMSTYLMPGQTCNCHATVSTPLRLPFCMTLRLLSRTTLLQQHTSNIVTGTLDTVCYLIAQIFLAT